jgi:transaldolase
MLPEDSPLRGKAAIANTKLAYGLFQEAFATERFAALRAKGARVQRFLCASTSTKDPDYRDVLYVEELIGPDTVNTLPLPTIDAFRDHGEVRASITEDIEGARADLAALPGEGIDLDDVCAKLQTEGVRKFSDSYDALLDGLAEKKAALLAEGV